MSGYVILAFALGALFGLGPGFVMGSRRVPTSNSEAVSRPDALASYARQSGENAARAVS